MLVGGALAYTGLISLSTLPSSSNGCKLAFVNNILASQAGALVAFMLKRVIGIFGTRSGAKALISGALAGLVSYKRQSQQNVCLFKLNNRNIGKRSVYVQR